MNNKLAILFLFSRYYFTLIKIYYRYSAAVLHFSSDTLYQAYFIDN